MALSMEEQRILAEIEQHLTRAEPALAARLTALEHPGAGSPFRSSRARAVASFVLLAVIVAVAFVMYALPFQVLPDRGGSGRPTATPRQPAIASWHQSSPASAAIASRATSSGATASRATASRAPSPTTMQGRAMPSGASTGR